MKKNLGERLYTVQWYSDHEIIVTTIYQIEAIRHSEMKWYNGEHQMKILREATQEDIEKYGSCVITGINDSRLLIASHIKPWRLSNNKERLSVNNGLLLSPLYDKLFDIGLISFNEQMRIIVSKQLSDFDINRIGIDTQKIYLDNPNDELIENLSYHRNIIFR